MRSNTVKALGTLAACAVLACAAMGCGGGSNVLHINTTVADFDQVVQKADKPVLVDFWKEGCASCGMLDPTIAQLADEYRGRAVVASFIAHHFAFDEPCHEINHRYDIGFVPTVILFVKGEEKHRWVMDYSIDAYRKELDKVVAPAASKPDAGAKAAAK
jgi:thioredoxin 1